MREKQKKKCWCFTHAVPITPKHLYSKAYQFAVNAVIDMIEQDMILARVLQRGYAKW